MKIYLKHRIALIAVLFSVTACNVMDTQPKELYDDNMVWSTKRNAEAFIVESYNVTVELYTGRNAKMEALTPNGIQSEFSNLNGTPTETSLDRYSDLSEFDRFGALRRCNLIIENVASSAMPEADKKALIAEGYFLRGIVFFYQARWLGRLVPITKVLSPGDKEAFSTPFTADAAASYKLVIDDLTKAAEGLPQTAEPGRATKYAAQAFISRAALQAYAYTMDQKYLDLSISASADVIANSKATLTTEYGKLFQPEGAYDPEILLGYYRLAYNTQGSSFPEIINVVPNVNNDELTNTGATPLFKNPGGGNTFEGWGNYFPTQDLIDQYLVIDAADGRAKPIYETSQYKSSVAEGDPGTLEVGDFVVVKTTGNKVPDQDDMGSNSKGPKIVKYGRVTDNSRINEIMYLKRDLRFYGTVVHDSTIWLNNELVTTACLGNLWAGVRNGQADSWFTTASGYYWRKNVYDVKPRVFHNTKTDMHFVIARLGEMYMNLAEAYLLKNDVPKAVEALNATRVKHGGLPPSTASTLQEAWTDYIRERRVEMAYENDIYWSYLRWGKYGGFANEGAAPGAPIAALNRPVHKIQITKNRKEFFIGQITRNGAWNRIFTVRRYLMPIPQGILDRRAASGIVDPQNPGW